MRIKLLLCICYLWSFSLDAQNKELRHYYIELKGRSSEEIKVEYGYISWKGLFMKKKAFPNYAAFFEVMNQEAQQMTAQSTDLLLYFHSMLGNIQPYFGMTLRQFNKDLLKNPASEVKTVLSIIWHAGVNYERHWEDAKQKGKYLAPVLDSLFQIQKAHPFSINVLGHSMGNRLIQGLVEELPDDNQVWDELILAAADLDPKEFADSSFVNKLHKVAARTHVYVYKKDKVLWFSSLLTGEKRLGAKLDDPSSIPETIFVLDIGRLKWRTGLSGHIYFTSSKIIRTDIFEICNNTPSDQFQHRTKEDSNWWYLEKD